MSQPSNDDAFPPLPQQRPLWITWGWVALAGAVVVVMVFGCLHAGRPFWHLACERSSSLSSLRA